MMLPAPSPHQPPPLAIQIRAMRMEDIPQVQAIDQASFSLPWPESAFVYELKKNPNSRLWVAVAQPTPGEANPGEHNERVVGMVVVWQILDEAHIATIAVDPAHRRQGIGTRLLVKALLEAIRAGMRQATLEVRASNLAAQNLYLRYGFKIVGRRPRYYKDNQEDAIIMTNDHLGLEFESWLTSVHLQGVSNDQTRL